MILWVDTETTGLDPLTDYLLEVSLVLSTNDLVPVHHTTVQIATPMSPNLIPMDDAVRDMHTKNGLLEDLRYYGVDIFDAEDHLLKWMDDCGIKNQEHPMAGSSVGFDRGFLKRHMPRVEKRFHYRNIDVSTVKELARRWGAPQLDRQTAAKHRAYDDVLASIEELTHYRDSGFLAMPEGGFT